MNRPNYVAPGELFKPKAADWNAFVDATRVTQQTPKAEVGPATDQPRDRNTILVQNTATATVPTDIPRWGVMVLQSPLALPSDNEQEFERRVAMYGQTPTPDDVPLADVVSIGIAQEPIAVHAIGRCVIDGMTHANIDVLDEDHRYATIGADEPFLQSASGGRMRIVWKEAGTGLKRAIVAFDANIVRWWRVVGNTLIAPNRWSYDLEDPTNPLITAVGRNKMEDDNTAGFAGPSYDLGTLPTDWELLPIGATLGGATIGCIVDAWQSNDEVDIEEGEYIWRFCKTNIVDGPCGEGGVAGPGVAYADLLSVASLM